MSPSSILTLLMGRLGSKTEPTLRAICLLEMQLFQETMLEGGPQLPWFTIERDYPLVTVADTREIAVPSDFIREVDEEKSFRYIPDDTSEKSVKLVKMGYDEAMEHYGSTADGPPEAYALRGEYFEIFPIPDAVYNLELTYYKRQTTLADNDTENNWAKWAADLLLAGTGEVVAIQHLQDTELGISFNSLKNTATDRLTRMDVAREEANRDRRMG